MDRRVFPRPKVPDDVFDCTSWMRIQLEPNSAAVVADSQAHDRVRAEVRALRGIQEGLFAD